MAEENKKVTAAELSDAVLKAVQTKVNLSEEGVHITQEVISELVKNHGLHVKDQETLGKITAALEGVSQQAPASAEAMLNILTTHAQKREQGDVLRDFTADEKKEILSNYQAMLEEFTKSTAPEAPKVEPAGVAKDSAVIPAKTFKGAEKIAGAVVDELLKTSAAGQLKTELGDNFQPTVHTHVKAAIVEQFAAQKVAEGDVELTEQQIGRLAKDFGESIEKAEAGKKLDALKSALERSEVFKETPVQQENKETEKLAMSTGKKIAVAVGGVALLTVGWNRLKAAFTSREATQEDVDAGKAQEVGEKIGPSGLMRVVNGVLGAVAAALAVSFAFDIKDNKQFGDTAKGVYGKFTAKWKKDQDEKGKGGVAPQIG